VKNNKTANNPTTTKARQKIRSDLVSYFKVCLCRGANPGYFSYKFIFSHFKNAGRDKTYHVFPYYGKTKKGTKQNELQCFGTLRILEKKKIYF